MAMVMRTIMSTITSVRSSKVMFTRATVVAMAVRSIVRCVAGIAMIFVIAAMTTAKTFVLDGATIGALSVRDISVAIYINTVTTVAVSVSAVAVIMFLIFSKSVASAVIEVLKRCNAESAILVALVAAVSVLELFKISVALSNTSDSLNICGVTSIVSNATSMVVVMLVAEVVIIGTVVPGT